MGRGGCEDLIGFVSEQQVELPAVNLASGLIHHVVPIGRRPAAEVDAAGGVLLRPARRLHNAAEADERTRAQITHIAFLSGWRGSYCLPSSCCRRPATRSLVSSVVISSISSLQYSGTNSIS